MAYGSDGWIAGSCRDDDGGGGGGVNISSERVGLMNVQTSKLIDRNMSFDLRRGSLIVSCARSLKLCIPIAWLSSAACTVQHHFPTLRIIQSSLHLHPPKPSLLVSFLWRNYPVTVGLA